MVDVKLTYFDNDVEIYVYSNIADYRNHKSHMLRKGYAIESEDVIGNNEAYKVEYSK